MHPAIDETRYLRAFLFRVTLRRPEIADQIEYIAEPQKIPLVLSPEEVRRLLAAAPGFKYRLLLSLTYGCGLRAPKWCRSGCPISTAPRW